MPAAARLRLLVPVTLLLAIAAGRAVAQPRGAALADLPFLHRDVANRVIVDVTPVSMSPQVLLVVDTGASRSLVSPLLAHGLGVSPDAGTDVPHVIPTRLGRDLRYWVDAGVADPRSEISFEHGLLGGNFLSHYVVDLDFSMRRVRFLDPARFQVPGRAAAPGEMVLPLQILQDRPYVEISLDGRPFRALIDTGDPSSLILPSAVAADLGVSPRRLQGFELWGTQGRLHVGIGQVEAVTVGSLRFSRVPVLVRSAEADPAGTGGVLIGYDLISQFQVRIDYPRARLWLRPRPERSMTFLGHPWAPIRTSGVVVQRGAVMEVRYVIEGSPAWSLGLRPGDRIRASSLTGPGDPVEQLAAAIASGGAVTVMRSNGAGGSEERRLGGWGSGLTAP